jgi:hypothetical protein
LSFFSHRAPPSGGICQAAASATGGS